jgi:hypothetical protein
LKRLLEDEARLPALPGRLLERISEATEQRADDSGLQLLLRALYKPFPGQAC